MRLIDADALPRGRVEWEDIVNAPTVDAVEVVRCGECKHYKDIFCGLHVQPYCDREGREMREPSDFCSYGEKK